MNIELASLTGKGKLQAVEFRDEYIILYGCKDLAKTMLFMLDGKTYKAIEDPSDGDGSTLGSFLQVSEVLQDKFKFKKPISVLCQHVTDHEGSFSKDKDDDVLQMIDIKTGQIILEVGTENCGDYYPGFVATFHRERLAKLEGKK